MSKALIIIRKATKNIVFKLYESEIEHKKEQEQDNNTDSVIRRCLSDHINRSYCASPIKIKSKTV